MNFQHVKTLAMTVILAFSTAALAASEFSISTSPTEQKFEDVILAKSRTIKSPGLNAELKQVSHGLRKKAVFGLVPVRVYVAEFFAANPEKLVKSEDGFLASLKDAGPVQLRITFLRDLPGEKIAESFKEGLKANDISPRNMSPELTQAMGEVSAIDQFKKGDTFSITGVWTGDKSSLLLEDMKQIKTIQGSKELAHQIFSIWFGKPGDGKLGDLKKELVK